MENKTVINGGCHCGNISYDFATSQPFAELPLRACSCSFCSKQGAVYTSDPNGLLSIHIRESTQVQNYRFATEVVDFMFCGICGVMPLATMEHAGKTYALINAKTINGGMPDTTVAVIDFTGETKSESIERRKKNWIADVQYA